MKEVTKGRIVSALVPGMHLLGTRLGRWYERNPHHRFNAGDILILRHRHFLGYGIRPVGVVKGYEVMESAVAKAGRYNVTMYIDGGGGDCIHWMRQNEVPLGVERVREERETSSKWNIENHFKSVRVASVEEALALYASRAVMPQVRVA